jgi:hypothetical protein
MEIQCKVIIQIFFSSSGKIDKFSVNYSLLFWAKLRFVRKQGEWGSVSTSFGFAQDKPLNNRSGGVFRLPSASLRTSRSTTGVGEWGRIITLDS